MHDKSDAERIRTTQNTARYFTENRQVSWVLLIGTILWGFLSYVAMPKRKDPEIPVRVCAAIGSWPGASAENVEELITRKMEQKIAENAKVEKIESTTRGSVAIVTVTLRDDTKDTGREFDDIRLKLDTIRDLPQGANPIQFIKDFGDTTALMLTVASPKVSGVEIQLRAEAIQMGIVDARGLAASAEKGRRVSLVYAFPASLDPAQLRRVVEQMGVFGEERGVIHDVHFFEGKGFLGLDASTTADEATLRASALRFLQDRLRTSELHPDVWRAIVVFDPKETEEKLAAVAESKYSYRELDDFTESLQHRLEGVKEVSKSPRKRRQTARRPFVHHNLHRRRRPALLVQRGACAAAGELRPARPSGVRQGGHQ